MKRPWLYVTGEKTPGLRSLDEVRRGIQRGRAAHLWHELVAKVEAEAKKPPRAPRSGNRSYPVVADAAYRIMDASLVALITGERRYADAALRQIDALFDPEQWPDWRDKAHIQAGLHADLRHGQLARALGMAYDWLHGMLTEQERRRIRDGLDRCAIPQFKAGLEAGEHWGRRRSNWMTCVVGGFGILGMALGPDHPDAEWLVEVARPRMAQYMSVFGPEGEFNETVQYAGSTMYVVDYFTALYYATRGKENPLKEHGLGDFCRWYMYATVPPGRVFGFGDPMPDMPPVVGHLAAVASVLRDPLVQWFYLQYADLMLPSHRQRALELLYFDPALDPTPPQGRLPLGRAYHAQARLISSRSSWDPKRCASVVYAKAGKEDYHCHADWGNLCIDGFGQRLIVDLGSPRGGYPRSHKERYYNYQQAGHNVLVFDEDENGGITWNTRRQGETTWAEFDDALGAAWTMDLSAVYGEGRRVMRHVVHLLPRVAVVLDEAALPKEERIDLRWHTIKPAAPDSEGRFTVQAKGAALAGCVRRLDGPGETLLGRHEYKPPFDKNRYGKPYPQPRQPFVQLRARDNRCRILSLFCVFGPDEEPQRWTRANGAWAIETPEGAVQARVEGDRLRVRNAAAGRAWDVALGARP